MAEPAKVELGVFKLNKSGQIDLIEIYGQNQTINGSVYVQPEHLGETRMTKAAKTAKAVKDTYRIREVPEMNIAIWEDGYDWLQNNGRIAQTYLNQVRAAVDRGYNPDEIYHQVKNEAGRHRLEIAERCRAAANYLIHENSGG